MLFDHWRKGLASNRVGPFGMHYASSTRSTESAAFRAVSAMAEPNRVGTSAEPEDDDVDSDELPSLRSSSGDDGKPATEQ